MTPKSISRECINAVHAQTGVMVLTDAMAERIASAVLSAAEQPEPPAPLKVWPGLEGKGLAEARLVYTDARPSAGTHDDACRVANTALAAHFWRAMVASLPEATTALVWVGDRIVPRATLAALADPYDGGGKGVGK